MFVCAHVTSETMPEARERTIRDKKRNLVEMGRFVASVAVERMDPEKKE